MRDVPFRFAVVTFRMHKPFTLLYLCLALSVPAVLLGEEATTKPKEIAKTEATGKLKADTPATPKTVELPDAEQVKILQTQLDLAQADSTFKAVSEHYRQILEAQEDYAKAKSTFEAAQAIANNTATKIAGEHGCVLPQCHVNMFTDAKTHEKVLRLEWLPEAPATTAQAAAQSK